MESLLQLDQDFLLAINSWHASWADECMWIVSQKWTWIPLYVSLVCLIVLRFGWKKSIFIFVGFALAIGCSDLLASQVIKPLVERLRPTNEPALKGLIHLVKGYKGGLYGFASSHAANTMSCALLFCLIWQNEVVEHHHHHSHHHHHEEKKHNRYMPWLAWTILMLWVALNCYSRMYLGVHYPLDIIGGLLIGTGMAVLVYWALCRMGVVVLK